MSEAGAKEEINGLNDEDIFKGMPPRSLGAINMEDKTADDAAFQRHGLQPGADSARELLDRMEARAARFGILDPTGAQAYIPPTEAAVCSGFMPTDGDKSDEDRVVFFTSEVHGSEEGSEEGFDAYRKVNGVPYVQVNSIGKVLTFRGVEIPRSPRK